MKLLVQSAKRSPILARCRLLALAAAAAVPPAWATQVAVVGLFKDKAIIRVDNGPLRTLSAGETVDGVRLLSASAAAARIVVDGRPRTLAMGQSFVAAVEAPTRPSVSLFADGRGQFTAAGAINGHPVRFLVDTGATSVAIDAQLARRIGLDYRRTAAGAVNTAGGVVPAWYVTFATVKVGPITAYQVEGVVVESALATPLLGMSFLKRMDMKRDGQAMVLTQRY